MEKALITVKTKTDLENELQNLLHVERPNVIDEISAAREQGDLSENAEFDAAREKQAHIEDRIREIQDLLENHILINEHTATSSKQITIGSKVTVKNLDTKQVSVYQIIGSIGVDPFAKPQKISNLSPIGQALINKKVDEVVKIKNVQHSYNIKVLKID